MDLDTTSPLNCIPLKEFDKDHYNVIGVIQFENKLVKNREIGDKVDKHGNELIG